MRTLSSEYLSSHNFYRSHIHITRKLGIQFSQHVSTRFWLLYLDILESDICQKIHLHEVIIDKKLEKKNFGYIYY